MFVCSPEKEKLAAKNEKEIQEDIAKQV